MDMISPNQEQPAMLPSHTGGVVKAMATTDEMLQFSRSNLEAVTKANQVLAAGIQDFMQRQGEAAKASMAETLAAFTSFGSVKTFQDVLDIQSGLLRSAMDRAMENHRQMAASSMQLIKHAFEPTIARMPSTVGLDQTPSTLP